VAEIFIKAVTKLIAFIDKGKLKPTKKSKLLPTLKAVLKKNPDQIAEILLSGIYADVDAPVKVFESSTATGKQLYKIFKLKHIDTFYPETGGGYAIVKDPSPIFLDKKGYYKPFNLIDELCNGVGAGVNGFDFDFFSLRIEMMSNASSFFQFYRMILDVLSDYLAIPLNQGYEEIGLYSFKHQAGSLEIYRRMLFRNLKRIAFLNNELSDLVSEYKEKTIEQYYPSSKVVDFCKTKITNMSEYSPEWFYDIKDFYMKEERIKDMPAEEIEHLESVGNKEQIRHFKKLVEQANSNGES